MKAELARERAIRSAGKELTNIAFLIEKAVEESRMCISVNNLTPAARESLISDGYKVEQDETPGITLYHISW